MELLDRIILARVDGHPRKYKIADLAAPYMSWELGQFDSDGVKDAAWRLCADGYLQMLPDRTLMTTSRAWDEGVMSGGR